MSGRAKPGTAFIVAFVASSHAEFDHPAIIAAATAPQQHVATITVCG
jgi:hypothetical protein